MFFKAKTIFFSRFLLSNVILTSNLLCILEVKLKNFWLFFFQAILSEPSWILIIFYILSEYKSIKIKSAIWELKNPYEQIFVRHPVCFFQSSPTAPAGLQGVSQKFVHKDFLALIQQFLYFCFYILVEYRKWLGSSLDLKKIIKNLWYYL